MDRVERKITKIGNSLGMTIPAELLAQANSKQRNNIQRQLEDGTICLIKNWKVTLPEGNSEDFSTS